MILVLSDIHVGDSHADKNLNKLFSILEKYGNKSNTLILNGDIIDLAKTPNVDKRHRRLFSLAMRFGHVYYVEGNHDWFFSGFEDTFHNFTFAKQLYLKIGDKEVLVTHGDEVDFFSGKAPVFVRVLIKVNKWIEGLVGIDLQHRMKRYLFSEAVSARLENRMFQKYRGQYDIIIMGHTHCANKIEKYDMTLYNTGGWTEFGDCHYLSIDGDRFLLEKI
jgi:UDP-2,3-diacylglucosamine pyrophosphatase LpxH